MQKVKQELHMWETPVWNEQVLLYSTEKIPIWHILVVPATDIALRLTLSKTFFFQFYCLSIPEWISSLFLSEMNKMTEIQKWVGEAGRSIIHTSCSLQKRSVNPKQSISSDTEGGGCTHSQHSEISLSPTKNTICPSVWKKRESFGGHKTALVESDVYSWYLKHACASKKVKLTLRVKSEDLPSRFKLYI